ncbi:MAG: integrin alpha [Myxococcota bacterium]
MGANLSDTTAINAGSAFVFYGDSSVFVDDSTQLDSDQASSSFGFSVASAGDVNGDGFADVIVGAQSYDAGPGNDNEGRAFLFHGSSPKIPNGSVGAADTTFSSGQATSSFGASVAAAGDVNGDGFPDVVIGSPRYDNGETDEGVAFVYLGSATGIASGDVSTAAAWIESDQAGAELGWAVASAGDVNHDGFADLVVGAPEYDAGQTDEGAAFVVLSGPEFGRPALPRQYQAGGGDEIPPWGLSNLNGFDVTLPATHPAGRGLVKLEVEWCPPGAPFGNVVCGSQVSTNWTDVTATATGVTLTETLLGLSADTLYRWRARVLHAPFSGDAPGITQKANPPHGPWRRPQAQAREADLRVLPEPGAVSLLAAGAGWLGILHRWRRRSGSEPQPGAGNM